MRLGLSEAKRVWEKNKFVLRSQGRLDITSEQRLFFGFSSFELRSVAGPEVPVDGRMGKTGRKQ